MEAERTLRVFEVRLVPVLLTSICTHRQLLPGNHTLKYGQLCNSCQIKYNSSVLLSYTWKKTFSAGRTIKDKSRFHFSGRARQGPSRTRASREGSSAQRPDLPGFHSRWQSPVPTLLSFISRPVGVWLLAISAIPHLLLYLIAPKVRPRWWLFSRARASYYVHVNDLKYWKYLYVPRVLIFSKKTESVGVVSHPTVLLYGMHVSCFWSRCEKELLKYASEVCIRFIQQRKRWHLLKCISLKSCKCYKQRETEIETESVRVHVFFHFVLIKFCRTTSFIWGLGLRIWLGSIFMFTSHVIRCYTRPSS